MLKTSELHDMFIYVILANLAKEAKTYLGVGVQEGECVRSVLLSNPDIYRIVLCDTWGATHGGTNRGNPNHIEKMLEEIGWKGHPIYLSGPSEVLIPESRGLIRTVDLSFVDGDHSEAGALTDLRNVWSLTRKFMVIHDTAMPSVASALTIFLGEAEGITSVRYSQNGTGTAVVYR